MKIKKQNTQNSVSQKENLSLKIMKTVYNELILIIKQNILKKMKLL